MQKIFLGSKIKCARNVQRKAFSWTRNTAKIAIFHAKPAQESFKLIAFNAKKDLKNTKMVYVKFVVQKNTL